MQAINDLPPATRKRLVQLEELLKSWSGEKITSAKICELTGWKDSLVRHDLWLINQVVSTGSTTVVTRGWKNGYNTAGLLAVVWTAMQMRKLQTAGQALAAGDLSVTVDTKHMLPALKEHAENLGAVSLGMTKAVNERMKSERFKTELITNVSHDLKTPLTSIVSYVDLLKAEDIDNEKAKLSKVDQAISANKKDISAAKKEISKIRKGIKSAEKDAKESEKVLKESKKLQKEIQETL